MSAETIISRLSKYINVEKAVNVAFITVIMLGLTAIQDGNTALAIDYFKNYFFYFFLLYISVPMIKSVQQYVNKKLVLEDNKTKEDEKYGSNNSEEGRGTDDSNIESTSSQHPS